MSDSLLSIAPAIIPTKVCFELSKYGYKFKFLALGKVTNVSLTKKFIGLYVFVEDVFTKLLFRLKFSLLSIPPTSLFGSSDKLCST